LVAAGGFPNGYPLPNWRLFSYFGSGQVSTLVWPALFYLWRERPVRWLGLLAGTAPFAAMNLVASTRYPALAGLWSLPVLLVLALWALESRRKNTRVQSNT
jgi:hypothetical protein